MIVKFDACPNCSSTRLAFNGEAKKLALDGKAPANFEFHAAKYEAIIGNAEMQQNQPLGGTMPVVSAIIDICLDCGTVYATSINITEATKSRIPTKPTIVRNPLIDPHGNRLPPGGGLIRGN